jgi:hypothetical protein
MIAPAECAHLVGDRGVDYIDGGPSTKGCSIYMRPGRASDRIYRAALNQLSDSDVTAA